MPEVYSYTKSACLENLVTRPHPNKELSLRKCKHPKAPPSATFLTLAKTMSQQLKKGLAKVESEREIYCYLPRIVGLCRVGRRRRRQCRRQAWSHRGRRRGSPAAPSPPPSPSLQLPSQIARLLLRLSLSKFQGFWANFKEIQALLRR